MKTNFLKLAVETLQLEANAIMEMSKRLDNEFEKAIEIILNTQGRVVVVGMGKSGLSVKSLLQLWLLPVLLLFLSILVRHFMAI